MRSLLIGLTTLALLVGCSSDDNARSDAGATGGDATAIQIRPVLLPCVDATTGDTTANVETAAPLAPEATAFVPLEGTSQHCSVGPSQADGTVFTDATARDDSVNGWGVIATLRPGAAGEGTWNALAAQCFEKAATCPSGQIAIVLDGVATSVATVQTPEFQGSIQISGTYTESQATALATLINAGAD